MAALDKDEVDFAKLEREVLGAMESEARYYRENDAKFRAVNQKVATYEEFRDIVLASHLKPLEKTDKMPEVFVQPWNCASSKVSSSSTSNTTKPGPSVNVKPNKIPTTSLGLVNDWRRLKDDPEKLDYLLVIGGKRLKEIFKTEISGGLLGDILRVLLSHRPESAPEVAHILDAMSSAKRFKLDLQFMSSTEKETCQKLFSKLSEETKLTDGVDESDKGTICSQPKDGLKEEDTTDTFLTEGSTPQTSRPMDEDVQRLATMFEVTL